MRRTRSRQLRLPTPSQPGHHLPDPVRRRCQALLSQLLIEIVKAELQKMETSHEREDPAESS